MPTHLMLDNYKILSVISFTLFGVGLAFYATPSTDAALSNLPPDQAGAGAGIYKMASSMGASFGVAIAASVYTAISGSNEGVAWIEGVITFVGNQENLAYREAAFFAQLTMLVLLVIAVFSITLTIPKGKPADRG
jgi:DHA2 family multidrug resistance protein-like MFS transporter